MKQIPLLCSTPMVQAIGDDRKTVTRRTRGLDKINEAPGDWVFMSYDKDIFVFQNIHTGETIHIKCPYGQPGDLLWVRETWSKIHYEGVDSNPTYIYKADMPDINRIWKPSIHMPKAAARYWLKVKSVRPERIQDMTEEDAKNEGAHMCHFENDSIYSLKEYTYNDRLLFHPTYKTGFKLLWASINGEESWKRNDWVWVIKFEQIQKL